MLGTISRNLALAGVKHLFIAGEMSTDEIHQRVLSSIADVYPSAFRSDYGKSQDFQERIGAAAIRLKGNVLYRNAPGLTFDNLKRIATQAVGQRRIKGIILDYWQLVRGQGHGQSTADHLEAVAQWIADFGRKHKIWTVAAAQINQQGNTRGSEGIRLAFDQVYQLHRLADGSPQFWLQMMDTRYTHWGNVGAKDCAGLIMQEKGPVFEDAQKLAEEAAREANQNRLAPQLGF
jgi:replicative DNA helicase